MASNPATASTGDTSPTGADVKANSSDAASSTYKAAELRYRTRFNIPANVPLDPEKVKMLCSVDDGPVIYDSDSDSDSDSDYEAESEEEDDQKSQTEPFDTAPATVESSEQVVSLLPMAGEDTVPDEARLVRIQNPSAKSEDWKKVTTSHKFRCKIKISESSTPCTNTPWLPTDQSKNDTVGMTVSIKSSDLAPQLSISLEFYRKGETAIANEVLTPRHSGSIDFSFGRVYKDASDRSREPNQIMNLQVKYGPSHNSAILEFDTTGATANNLKCISDFSEPHLHPLVKRMRPREDEVNLCKKLVSLTTGKAYHVMIMIDTGAKDFEAHKTGSRNTIDDFFAILPHKDNITADPTFHSSVKHAMIVPPYNQYRNACYKPRAQYGLMPAPSTVYDKHHPCLPMPMLPFYRDADEACIVLGNSVHTQFVEQQSILEAVERNAHKVKLLTMGDMVLIAITWTKRPRANLSSDERITYPLGTIIDFTIHKTTTLKAASDEVDPYLAKGHIIGNSFGILCDVLVMVLNKRAGDFIGMTAPLASAKIATSYYAALACKIDQHSCATMINAVVTTYARESLVTQQWSALLNDGAKLPTSEYLAHIECSQREWCAAYELLMNPRGGKPWTSKQIDFIELFLKAPGGIALATGPGGAGKTELILQLTAFCLRTGINVVITGMKHSTLDFIVKKFAEMFPDLPSPLRAYTDSLEGLLEHETVWGARDESEMRNLEMVRAGIEEQKSKRVSLRMTHSIQHRVLEYSKKLKMPKMVKRIPTGATDGAPVYKDEIEYDYRELFRESLAALPEHPRSDTEFWTDERLRKFKYVYAALRAEIIQGAPFLVGTMLILNDEEISQNWSQKKKSARFDDEAQACSEPSSLVGAALPKWSRNVKVWAMLGDLKQSGVTCLTGQGPDNTVDPFHAQSRISLFARLEKAGHPVVHLDTQCRLPTVFLIPLNELHYDMQVTTSTALDRDLTENRTLMGEIAGRSTKEIANQNDAQKRMLLVEVNSPTMRARDSPSRANPGFAAYVVEVVLPILRKHFGRRLKKKVMLVVPYAKQKELYLRHFFKLRSNGWAQNELPALYTINAAHGHEADFVIFDIVNDTREGFLSDPQRMCVAASRAKKQMLWITGDLSEVKTDKTIKYYRDINAGDTIKEVAIYRPLLHWKKYFESKKCTHQATPPDFEVPGDLAFYGDDF
ncbi:hypothetical protein E4T52_17353 [Aureobasidium sp. EXF-3400]|nr:hypothetical protein E4T51_16242 [Aureobasidium sp. EXF-12344]KAI4767474.1 hypothetical protein E4T52_17353 [Aureobasidium sp. EXF-3400]